MPFSEAGTHLREGTGRLGDEEGEVCVPCKRSVTVAGTGPVPNQTKPKPKCTVQHPRRVLALGRGWALHWGGGLSDKTYYMYPWNPAAADENSMPLVSSPRGFSRRSNRSRRSFSLTTVPARKPKSCASETVEANLTLYAVRSQTLRTLEGQEIEQHKTIEQLRQQLAASEAALSSTKSSLLTERESMRALKSALSAHVSDYEQMITSMQALRPVSEVKKLEKDYAPTLTTLRDALVTGDLPEERCPTGIPVQ